MTTRAYACLEPGRALEPYEYEAGPLGADEVAVRVRSCGICHSDLSMLRNDWGMTRYPFVGGHEVVGEVEAVGAAVPNLRVGDTVGVGWFARSCLSCAACLRGDHNLCAGREDTIVGRPGGFAERVRCQWVWATPLPAGVDLATAGPLFCGGITVFNPIIQCGVQPTHRAGVVGIGGLGHFALQFLDKWGCEVTAFTHSESKAEEALRLGADHVVNSRDSAALKRIAGTLDFILVTVNVELDWQAYLNCLAPRGRLHVVGAVPKPIPAPAFTLLGSQLSLSGSALGGPATVRAMLEFCARHGIGAVAERFPMSRINEAFAHLESGKARYRIILDPDW